jgi:hypothetical protein
LPVSSPELLDPGRGGSLRPDEKSAGFLEVLSKKTKRILRLEEAGTVLVRQYCRKGRGKAKLQWRVFKDGQVCRLEDLDPEWYGDEREEKKWKFFYVRGRICYTHSNDEFHPRNKRKGGDAWGP